MAELLDGPVVLAIGFVVSACLWWFFRHRSDPQAARGPWGLPLLGYYPFLGRYAHLTLTRLGEKYGEVFQLNLLGSRYYIISSYAALKESLVHQASALSLRPQDFYLTSWCFDYHAFAFKNGDVWWQRRKNFAYLLKEIEFEPRCHDVLSTLLQNIDATGGRPHDFERILANASFNIIADICWGQTYAIDDPEFKALLGYIRGMFLHAPGLYHNISGWAARLRFNPLNPHYRAMHDLKANGIAILQKKVDQRLRSGPTAGAVNDYIDLYLRKIKDNKEHFPIDGLAADIYDVTVAGTDTVAATCYFGLNLLTLNPKIQSKCRAEVDEVIGNRSPAYADRLQMPYMRAVILEVHRYTCLLPLSLARFAGEDVVIRGVKISKGSKVLLNLYQSMRDPKIFPDPETFDPMRFIDKQGEFVESDAVMNFSAGKRDCVGRHLSSVEIFLYLTSILQRYDLLPPTKDGPVNHQVFDGLTRIMCPFTMRLVKRVITD